MRHLRAGLITILALWSFSAAADDAAEATSALNDFIGAVASQDIAKIEAVLAPEYQIMRANGTGFSRADYLQGQFAAVDETFQWQFEDLVATTADNVLVVRYMLEIEETIEGRGVARRAPRITVFRRVGDKWLVSAHANFAATN
ncbi:MAG: nuclear transport factor 2 family protein [Pseudomonadota bacterium]